MINKKDFEVKLEDFRKKVIKDYNKKQNSFLETQVFRGHVESMSVYFEDEFTKFISEVLNDKSYKFYIDYTIGTRRPDLLITKNNKLVACIELKCNMGYCRDNVKKINESVKEVKTLMDKEELQIFSTRQIKYLKNNINKFEEDEIKKQIENETKNSGSMILHKTIKGTKNVMCMLISLTTSNISCKKLDNFTAEENVFSFISLFNGWYYELERDENRKMDSDLLYMLLEKIDNDEV